MTAVKLSTIRVEKPWGRHKLWPGFENPAPNQEPVGEIWYDAPPGVEADLMVKYLFTSEKLSIQVHPDDAAAKASGYPCGKDEAWVILDAEPGATIALGTVRPLSREELRAAALDGSIEELMHWQPVKAGDVIYSPAGVVHAIGAGLTLIEVQQNIDLTYRLYDYGRPRELHLDDGIAVSNPVPFEIESPPAGDDPTVIWELDSAKFSMTRYFGTQGMYGEFAPGSAGWFIPIIGSGNLCGQPFQAGECWMITGDFEIQDCGGSEFLLATSKGRN